MESREEKTTRKKKRTEKADLSLIADFGASGTKAIYWTFQQGKDKARSLLMSPSVINTKGIDLGAEVSEINVPEDRCYFEVQGESFALGYLAELFNGHEGLGQSKYLRAVLKVIGLLSVIVEKENFSFRKRTTPLKVNLVIFLPYGEVGNSRYFKVALKSFTQKLIKNSVGKFSWEVSKISIRSEGEGIYRFFSQQKLPESLGLLMVGYRNCSFLVGRSGAVVDGETTNLGMIRMVEQVGKAEGLTDYSALTHAIAASGPELSDEIPFQKLLAKEGDMLKETRLKNLVEAIKIARSDYLNLLSSKIRDIMATNINEMVISGGTATLLGESLEESLQKSFPWLELNWHGGLTVPSSLVASGDLYGRFADVYGEYLALCKKTTLAKV